MDNQREKERDRSRRGDRPSRFSDAPRDRSNDRDRSEGKRLFVSNIPYEFRWTELKDLFKEKVCIYLCICLGRFYFTIKKRRSNLLNNYLLALSSAL